MAINFSFVDNEIYGTESVNDITRCLVGAGIAPFVSKDAYSVSDLNSLAEAVVGEGVQLGGCGCSVETLEGQNRISVGPGIVFFENGVKLEVDGDGYEIFAPVNSFGFVFAYFNTGLQTADILFAEELPEEGYAVLLAEVSADNILIDKRTFARAKVATFGTNVVHETAFVLQEPEEYSAEGGDTGMKKYAVGRLKADFGKFNYAVLISTETNDVSKEPRYTGVFELSNNLFLISVHDDTIIRNKNILNYGANNIIYMVEMLDGEMVYYAYCYENSKGYINHSDDPFRILLV